MVNKVEPFYKMHNTEDKHEEAIAEFLKLTHTIEDTEKYWAVRAGFITGYEIAKKKSEAEKIKAKIDILEQLWSRKGMIDELRTELEQQLKQLENGSK